MGINARVLDHARHPRNWGELEMPMVLWTKYDCRYSDVLHQSREHGAGKGILCAGLP